MQRVAIVGGVGLLLLAAAVGASRDEGLLLENKVPTDGPGLLAYVKQRLAATLSDARVRELIAQLGDDSFRKREEASGLLAKQGLRVKRHLTFALTSEDLEIRTRARKLLERIENDDLSTQLLASAVKLLGKQKPAGAAELLLAHLPVVSEDPQFVGLLYEVREALVALAARDGKAEPVLVAALEDKDALKRTVAARALARARLDDQLPALRKLLADADRDVRLDVALELARRGQKEAVPVLIAGLPTAPTARFGQVEDTLFYLAGDQSPRLKGPDVAALRRYQEDWQKWWKDRGDKADFAALEASEAFHGRTMVVMPDDGEILDLNADKTVRWKIGGLKQALDVQPLPGDRVLVAEHLGDRVTERTSTGEVVWEKQIEKPYAAQRLPNGNTLLAQEDQVIEIDRRGGRVAAYSPPGGSKVMRARKLPGGDVVLIVQLGVTSCVRLDRFGNRLRTFGVEVYTSGGRLDVSPAGNLLIPELNYNRVAEYDPAGKVVRHVTAAQPIACTALANGHLLVTSMTENRAVELDRRGREVWEYKRTTRVSRAVRH